MKKEFKIRVSEDKILIDEEEIIKEFIIKRITHEVNLREQAIKDALNEAGYIHREKIEEGLRKDLKNGDGSSFNIIDSIIEQIMENIK